MHRVYHLRIVLLNIRDWGNLKQKIIKKLISYYLFSEFRFRHEQRQQGLGSRQAESKIAYMGVIL